MRYSLVPLLLISLACTDDGESDGIRVQVTIDGQTMPQTVSLNDGTSVVLDPSYLTIVGFALEPCESMARSLWRAIDPLPSARAHGEGSPTNLAVPVVVALSGPRASIEVGTLEPPPDRYCGLNLSIGPADDDAVRLPDADMIGRSLRVSGDHQGVPFSITSAASDHAHLVFASALELLAADARARLTIALDTGDSFDAVDFDAVTAAADIMDGLAAGLSMTVE